MILVVNVTGGAAYQQVLPATPPACQECPQSLTVTGAGGGGRDLIVVVDKKKVVEQLDKETTVKTEKLEKVETKQVVKQPASPDPPEVCKQPVGRVRFEPGRFLVRFQRQDVLDIADLIQGRSGTVLVVGRPELGRGTRQARRRAKKVGKALRDALKGRDGTQLPVLTQAASTDQPGTAETEACAGSHYGTAAVYLIEGLP